VASQGKNVNASSTKAVLLVGALYSDEAYFERARERLATRFGPTFMEAGPRRWSYTDYYAGELGPEILRRFLFFKNPVAQSSLADIKIATNRLEEELSTDGRRNINLDPGYITPAKLVLASTKDYSHRIYLGRGIFAEVTLTYAGDGFKPFPYTYRDYRDPHYLALFAEARERVREILG